MNEIPQEEKDRWLASLAELEAQERRYRYTSPVVSAWAFDHLREEFHRVLEENERLKAKLRELGVDPEVAK